MQRIDGNALAGPLSQVMAGDVTSALARCIGCRDLAVLAQSVVYSDGTRFVARCRRCDDVLLTVIDADGDVRLNLTGIATLTMQA